MKTIIAATDFTEVAQNATAYAAALVQQLGGKLLLFNLYSPSIHVSNARLSPKAFDESAGQTRARLERQAGELAEAYSIPVSTQLSVLGNMEEEVAQLFRIHDAQLLVMGMAARSLEQDLLGNTTTSVIHQFQFPVLAVPQRATFNGIDRILFACDNLHGVHRTILTAIQRLAKGLSASVEIFHVNNRIQSIKAGEVDDETIAHFGEGLEGVTYYYKDIASNSVIKAIADELEEIKADLLIMLPNRYGFWASLIHRSKTRIMASGLSIPLLSIPTGVAKRAAEQPGTSD